MNELDYGNEVIYCGDALTLSDFGFDNDVDLLFSIIGGTILFANSKSADKAGHEVVGSSDESLGFPLDATGDAGTFADDTRGEETELEVVSSSSSQYQLRIAPKPSSGQWPAGWTSPADHVTTNLTITEELGYLNLIPLRTNLGMIKKLKLSKRRSQGLSRRRRSRGNLFH